MLKMLTLLCPPISLWGLQDSTNKPPPSPLLGPSPHSWGFCSHDLLGKRMKEHRVLSSLPSLQLVPVPTRELALPKHGKVRWLKAQSQISANPRRIVMKYKYVHSALQYHHGSATPSQTTEHFAEKKTAKNLTIELFYSRLLTTL